jgi:hypothetical protein
MFYLCRSWAFLRLGYGIKPESDRFKTGKMLLRQEFSLQQLKLGTRHLDFLDKPGVAALYELLLINQNWADPN